MAIPVGCVTGELHMLVATQLRAARTTPTRQGVLSGSDIVTRLRSRLGRVVAPASERFSAAGQQRASARLWVLAVRPFTPPTFQPPPPPIRSPLPLLPTHSATPPP